MFSKIIATIRHRLQQLFASHATPPPNGAAPRPPAKAAPRAEESDTAAQQAGQKSPRKRRRPRRRKRPDSPADAVAAAPQPNAAPWDPSVFEVPLTDGKLRFHDIDLPLEILHAVYDLGFQYCTPIQAGILPSTLAGKDATGKAQTGTGKTAAFLISIFTRLIRSPLETPPRPGHPRALVLAPTRELAIQIHEEAKALSAHCPFHTVAVFGGMDYEKQRRQLKKAAVDILVATPGRLLDFQRQGDINLRNVEILVIDEADRMLDMGFIPDVRKIIHATPPKHQRQTLLFSATLTPDVIRLASQWTRDPVSVEIEPEQVATDTVDQVVYITTTENKIALLYNLITHQKLERVIVFCNRRDETRRLTERLQHCGIDCAMISGEIAQNKRMKTLDDFKSGKLRVLVATDVAGRGLHIEGVSHVVNYALPHDPEDYVHRIGRTGRAGATGTSVSFACEEDSFYLPDIEAFLGEKLHCVHPDENWLTIPPAVAEKAAAAQREARRNAPARPRTGGGRPSRGGGRRRPPQRTSKRPRATRERTGP